MLQRFRHLAAASIAAVAVVLTAASPASAEPALWVVKDQDSTLYLFGTVHVLKPDTPWRSAGVDKALAESSELWIEVEADDPAVMQPLILKYGLDPAKPLSSKMTPQMAKDLQAAAAGMGASAQALEPMRPWLAAVTLSVVPMIKAGYDPKSGVEVKLKTAAAAAGKPVRTLETPEEQVRFFADLPPATELDLLRSALEEAGEGAAVLDELVAAWSKGDTATLDRLMSEKMKDEFPAIYDVLLAQRNKAWAESIGRMLDGKGTALIAVGAGHLVGADSVQAQLAKRGIKAERVN